MKRPLITVGITCHAEGDWLLECWESLLAQTDDRWQAVLVMDGTQHAPTIEIFESLEHPRLRKERSSENRGPYPTRNRAFELTDTPYHFYLDGDDKLPHDVLARVYRVIEARPDAGVIYGDYQLFGGYAGMWRYPEHIDPEAFLVSQPIPGGSVYRKSLWEQLGGFAPELARGNADYDFHIGVLEARAPTLHLGGILMHYRVGHTHKVSSGYALRYNETHEIIVARHPRYFADPVRRERFLAQGEKRAALANRAAGNHQRAAELARAAMRRGLWHDRALWPLALPRPFRRRGS
ncbi:glycosyltransferase [Chondromyces crocatus]|uniref:Glycosyltransferase n=1 Tax=Chondromyces crocatus TaxID=52 RepID=A0A0K1ELC3_CHOCO|nr:glycosyltransferase [Chondromyces crocatus]AKT41679.1 glycosyltransferase [Chondromyces crocatus]